PATSPLSLHDALPIYNGPHLAHCLPQWTQRERNLDTRLALDRTLGRLSTDRRTEAQAGGIPLLYSLTKNTATRQLKARCDLQQGDRKSTRLNSSHVAI